MTDLLSELGQADVPKLERYKDETVVLQVEDLVCGNTAAEIMEGAWALEREFKIAPHISQIMTSAVLCAIRGQGQIPDDNYQDQSQAKTLPPQV